MSASVAKLELRPLARENAETMLRWMLDPEVAEDVGLRSIPTLERTLEWIARADVNARGIFHEGCHVGNVVLDQFDTHLQTARISIYLGEPTARGQGLAFAAMRLALARGFAQHGLYRIWLTVHERNTRAIQLYSKIGFRREGVLRGDFRLRGERVDAVLMGMLRSEFEGTHP